MNALHRPVDNMALSMWRRHVHATLDPGLRRLPAPTGSHIYLAVANAADVRTDTVRREFTTAANAVLAADRDQVQAKVDIDADAVGRLRCELRGLAEACNVPLRLLHQICAYHRSAIAPVWATVRAHHAMDRARRVRTLLEGGVEGLLRTLHPRLQWSTPTVSLLDGTNGEMHLDGRGLALVPSFFLRKPTLFTDPVASDGVPVLIYPVRLETDGSAEIWTATDADRALGRLLGRTRALILTAIASGVTTTGGIARRLGTSSAAVSQHIKVLRDARLVVTHRHGAGADHSITARGLDLLERWDNDF
jgi:DNA-binding transcriptional ArsR family regulator